MMFPLLIALAAAPTHLAVLEFEARGISAEEKASLIEVFTEEVARHFPGKVYSKKEMRELLLREERVQRLDKCDERGCYAELALALGAELMIDGSITGMGAGMTLAASLIDTRSNGINSRASLEWRGPAEGLPDAMRALAQRLMIADRELAPGAVNLSAETPGAAVAIDGKAYGLTPLGKVAGLSVGAHEVVAHADGFQPLTRAFIVLHGRDTVLDLRLVPEEESPLYAKWWLWTIAGGAAVGVAAAIAIASSGGTQMEPSGTVDVTWSPR